MWVDTLYHRFKERGSWLRASLYIRFERDTSNDQPFHLGKESNRLFLSLKIYHEWVLHFMCTKKVHMFFSSFWVSEHPNSNNAELVLLFLVFFSLYSWNFWLYIEIVYYYIVFGWMLPLNAWNLHFFYCPEWNFWSYLMIYECITNVCMSKFTIFYKFTPAT